MKIKIGKNMYWNPLILLKTICIALMIMTVIWAAVSYGELLISNTDINATDYPKLSDWNFWGMLGGF